MFSTDKFSDQVQLPSDLKAAGSKLVNENSTPVICFVLKWGFLSCPSLQSFRIGSIAQNENPETLEIFKSLKFLNFFVKFKKTLPKILGKIFGTKWRNPVKLDRKRKVLYLLLRVVLFYCYCQSVISGKETGH